jgi:hypothetical protein
MMVKKIQYATALDGSGSLVHVENAVKGARYLCPMCNEQFILRKSGKTGSGSRRSHFSHNKLTPNCTPEGVLHLSFKKMLIEQLDRSRLEKVPFAISWNCPTCNGGNSGNLLERVTYIREEFSLGLCRPDIALLDGHERVIIAIEIVVTHKPEETTQLYYRENGIVLVQINLESEDDLTRVGEIARNPSIVVFCTNHACSDRDRHRWTRRVVAQNSHCGRCGSLTENYSVEIDSVFGKHLVSDFSDEEIDRVKSARTDIEVRAGENQRGRFPVYVCVNCKRLRSRYVLRRL